MRYADEMLFFPILKCKYIFLETSCFFHSSRPTGATACSCCVPPAFLSESFTRKFGRAAGCNMTSTDGPVPEAPPSPSAKEPPVPLSRPAGAASAGKAEPVRSYLTGAGVSNQGERTR